MLSRQILANAIRVLSMDAVQKANSGHPGMPMGMADIAEVLWQDFLLHNPKNPEWFNRDRFMISNGHGAMLHYSLLYLCGYDLSLDDLKQFRQLNSKTPGHPEYGHTPGIETTTGPLGQGLANAVGMALAEKLLAETFNRPQFNVVDHHTYVFVGDGCLMEGISHEACSFAGTLGLGKLIVLWDDNGISIDGEVKDWFTDDTAQRFKAYHWQVIEGVDGHNAESVKAAIVEARANIDQPTLICCRTQIGFGSPNMVGTSAVHGAPLGADEVALVRKALNWPEAESFVIPAEILKAWDATARGEEREAQWDTLFKAYQSQYPELAAEFLRRQSNTLPADFNEKVQEWMLEFQSNTKAVATRKSSQLCINKFGPILPEFLGGSADLTPSNLTDWSGSNWITAQNFQGNYISYGVREFAMSAMMNGIALHKGFIPYGGTFLTFCDYARNAIRMSSLMKAHVIYVYTHDSIGLGEDGPTHQPIEHIAMLRMTPGLNVWRPCDTVETLVAWQKALEKQAPSVLLFTRQNVDSQVRNPTQIENIAKGAYVLVDTDTTPSAILISTGSEVELVVKAAQVLKEQGLMVRVVSMPCCEIFKQQSPEYRESVLPRAVKLRLAVEAGVSDYWHQWVGSDGEILGLDHFGASAPGPKLYEAFGFTVENIVKKLQKLTGGKNGN